MDFKSYKSKLSKTKSELLNAVESCSLARVQRLARDFWNSNKEDKLFNYILLVTALQRGHKSITRFLINNGCPAKVPEKTGYYCTPLYYAIKIGDLEIFKNLWKEGACIFNRDANDDSALELAMTHPNKDIIRFVLDSIKLQEGSKYLNPNHKDGIALFHAACWTGHFGVLELFLSRNFSSRSRSSFNRYDWKGFTPFHFACASPFDFFPALAVMTLLKSGDVDFFIKDEQNRTFVNLAFRNRYFSLILRDKNARERLMAVSMRRKPINPVDNNGLSHFHIFCSINDPNENATRLIKYFIDNRTDVNSSVSLEDQDFPGYTALHFAAKKSSWKVFKFLLENGADPTKADKEEVTPLNLVCTTMTNRDKNRLEIVDLLLRCGANPAEQDSEGRTPLHIVIGKNYDNLSLDDFAKLLLSRNQSGINYTDKHGFSYMHIACMVNDLASLKILVNNGASVHSYVNKDSRLYSGYAALHFAVEFKRIEIVEYLLTIGADASGLVGSQVNPLSLACYHQFTELSRPNNEDGRERDSCIWTPSIENHIRIIELLIKHGASVNEGDTRRRSPLLSNFFKPRFPDTFTFSSLEDEIFKSQKFVMDKLLDLGANINAQSEIFGSILHVLIENYKACPRNKDLLELALDKGADINAIGTYRGITPLYLAVKGSTGKDIDLLFSEPTLDTSLVDLLLKRGANVNAKCKNLDTPLHLAVERTIKYKFGLSLIDLLLKGGADINAKNENFDTPLHLAMRSNDSGSVSRMLIQHPDIDVNAHDSHGQTPLFVAINKSHYYDARILLGYGADIHLDNIDGQSPLQDLLKSVEANPDFLDERSNLNFVVNIIIYIKILKELKRHISQKVNHHFEALSQYLDADDLTSIDSQIHEEIEYMKSQHLDNYTSLYDILFKDPNAMTKHAQNFRLRGIWRWTYELRHFTVFIEKQINQGLKRSQVLIRSKVALNFISNVDWPDSCSDEILSYLSDQDLNKLVVFSPPEERRKRSASDTALAGGFRPKIARLDNQNHENERDVLPHYSRLVQDDGSPVDIENKF